MNQGHHFSPGQYLRTYFISNGFKHDFSVVDRKQKIFRGDFMNELWDRIIEDYKIARECLVYSKETDCWT